MNRFIARTKADNKRIVLEERTEERTMRAADLLLADGIAYIILIGDPAIITEFAQKNNLKNLNKATIVDPKSHEKKEVYTNLLLDLRKSKGMTLEQAQKLVENPLFLACLMIKNGDADGEVAGAANTTGDV